MLYMRMQAKGQAVLCQPRHQRSDRLPEFIFVCIARDAVDHRSVAYGAGVLFAGEKGAAAYPLQSI